MKEEPVSLCKVSCLGTNEMFDVLCKSVLGLFERTTALPMTCIHARKRNVIPFSFEW